MIHAPILVVLLVVAVSISLLAYSITPGLSGHYLFLNEVIAQQDFESGANTDGPTEECLPNQHRVGLTDQCEWDNCGSATPPMYRNTQTGRCVSDCSELGEFWVEQGNVCVLGEARETIPVQSAGSLINQEDGNITETIQNDTSIEISSENETATPSMLAQPVATNATTNSISSNISSTPSTIAQTVAGLGGEPQVPYACFSNTFTCYCDGTEDCNRLTSSGECKEEVRAVEGEPGLGQCGWNVVS